MRRSSADASPASRRWRMRSRSRSRCRSNRSRVSRYAPPTAALISSKYSRTVLVRPITDARRHVVEHRRLADDLVPEHPRGETIRAEYQLERDLELGLLGSHRPEALEIARPESTPVAEQTDEGAEGIATRCSDRAEVAERPETTVRAARYRRRCGGSCAARSHRLPRAAGRSLPAGEWPQRTT